MPVLITTDVAARGIDIPLIDNVINFDFPPKPELFVHRAGRAARMGRPGAALSLVLREELPYLLDLHLYLGRAVAPAPEAPDAAAVAAARAAAAGGGLAGGLVAPAAGGEGGAAARSVFGSFPSALLEPVQEHLKEVIEATQDLAGAQRTLANAYGLYLKTRPAASSESVRRAKALAREGAHPELLARLPAGRMADVEVKRVAAAVKGGQGCQGKRQVGSIRAGCLANSLP